VPNELVFHRSRYETLQPGYRLSYHSVDLSADGSREASGASSAWVHMISEAGVPESRFFLFLFSPLKVIRRDGIGGNYGDAWGWYRTRVQIL